jgi:enterochelin esterase-like enzyme
VPEFPATAVEGDTVVFRLADPGRELTTVRLWVDLDVRLERDLVRREGGWELRVAALPLDRVEYLLEADGLLVPDPGNPLRVGGAFGDHSWLPLPGYRPPGWLDLSPAPGLRTPVCVRDTPVGEIGGEMWAPEGTSSTQPLPLLVSHDGPEMDAFGRLTQYVGALVEQGRLPAMRVALLAPGERNARYAANERYAAALTERVLPALRAQWPTVGAPVLMGQSLGALAALHVAWTRPRACGGLFLQSGSFFTPELDPQESGYSHWRQVTGFVRSVHDAMTAAPGSPPVTVVCGTAEENLGNNRLMAEHLTATGLTVSWGEGRDGHNWTCWRDLLEPHLTDLLTAVWS